MDFVVTANSKELLRDEVQPLVETFLSERGLQLSPEKTTITHIEDGFDFLGQNVRKYPNGKLLIKPSRQNVQTFLEIVRAIFKVNRQATAGNLIVQLNPLLRGWANYHRHVNSKQTFTRIDHLLFQRLWRWACRRHPNKGRHWVYRRYFQAIGDNTWVFPGEVSSREGTPRSVHLYQISKTPIRRHVKVLEKANPYDRAWQLYFEEHLGVKMSHSLRGRRKLYSL